MIAINQDAARFECVCKVCGETFTETRERYSTGGVIGGDTPEQMPTRCPTCALKKVWTHRARKRLAIQVDANTPQHEMAEDGKTTIECTCDICDRKFNVIRRLTTHGSVEGGAANLPRRCVPCRHRFGNTGANIEKCREALRNPQTCDRCHQVFYGRKRKYCSAKCQGEVRAELDRKIAEHRRLGNIHTCRVCGKQWTGQKAKACPECRDERGVSLQKKQCLVCGKEIVVSGRLALCSEECRLRRECELRKIREAKSAAARKASQKQWRLNEKGSIVHRVGDIAEAMFDLFAAVNGYLCARIASATASRDVDRLLDRGHGVERVQVKGMMHGTHKREVQLKRSRGRGYAASSFDLLAIVDTDTGDMWLIPWVEVNGKGKWIHADRWDKYKTHCLNCDINPQEHMTPGGL